MRKLDQPVRRGWWVLDVGSGAAPSPYANVLVEYDPAGVQTLAGPAQAQGRVLVWADAQRLPFRDGAFDYSVCSHVLEHVDQPGSLLAELERVSRGGYVESPNEIFDHVIPYVHHPNRVSFDGKTLRVFKKDRWNVERFQERYGRSRAEAIFAVLARDPARIHVEYRWTGHIDWVASDERISDGASDAGSRAQPGAEQVDARLAAWNAWLGRLVRRTPLSEAQVLARMRCPRCRAGVPHLAQDGGAECGGCNARFRRVWGHLDFR